MCSCLMRARPSREHGIPLLEGGEARPGFDAASLRVSHGGTIIQFAWETDIALGQDAIWPAVWTELAIEERLFLSQHLIDAINAIIKAQRAA